MPYSIFMVMLLTLCLVLPGCNTSKRSAAASSDIEAAQAALAQEAARVQAERQALLGIAPPSPPQEPVAPAPPPEPAVAAPEPVAPQPEPEPITAEPAPAEAVPPAVPFEDPAAFPPAILAEEPPAPPVTESQDAPAADLPAPPVASEALDTPAPAQPNMAEEQPALPEAAPAPEEEAAPAEPVAILPPETEPTTPELVTTVPVEAMPETTASQPEGTPAVEESTPEGTESPVPVDATPEDDTPPAPVVSKPVQRQKLLPASPAPQLRLPAAAPVPAPESEATPEEQDLPQEAPPLEFRISSEAPEGTAATIAEEAPQQERVAQESPADKGHIMVAMAKRPTAPEPSGSPLIEPLRSPKRNVDALADQRTASSAAADPPPLRPVLFEEPESSRRKRPALIYLHEAGSSPNKAATRHGLVAAARDAGVLLVIPQGSGPQGSLAWNAGTCCGPAQDTNAPDLAWIGHLIDSLPSQYKVDTKQIYLAGQGNGAMMAYRAACAYADRLAGLAVIGGPMDAPGCRPAKVLPVLHIHSMEDFQWPYFGGEVAKPLKTELHTVNSAIRSAVFWARTNQCSEEYKRFTQGSAIWERFNNCPEEGRVTLLSLSKDAGQDGNPYAKYPVGFKILEYFGLTKEWAEAKKNSIDVMPGIR